MAQIPIPAYEQQASIAAMTEALDKNVPGMYRSFIKPDMIAYLSYIGLEAAAQARHAHEPAQRPATPQPPSPAMHAALQAAEPDKGAPAKEPAPKHK